MASHFPVHIDQEEILRQSFCLSQTRCVLHLGVYYVYCNYDKWFNWYIPTFRHDSDIEEKRQHAIEQVFNIDIGVCVYFLNSQREANALSFVSLKTVFY